MLRVHPVAIALAVTLSMGACASDSASPPLIRPATTQVTGPATTMTTSTSTTTPSTTAPATTSTTAIPAPTLRRIWYLREERLVPAYRNAATVDEAVRALLTGPASSDPEGLLTTIPVGTTLRGITTKGSIATVDLDSRFESGGGSSSMVGRILQIVYTVTETPGVTGVLFALDGKPVEAIGGEGVVVSPPVTRDTFPDRVPHILASEPTPGQVVSSPLRIAGQNATYENNIEIALRTSDGRLLLQTFATGGGSFDETGRYRLGPFETSLEFYAGAATSGVLSLTETSPDDSGRLLGEFSIPVTFAPTSTPAPAPLPDGSLQPVITDGCCPPGSGTFLRKVTTQKVDGAVRVTFAFTAPISGYHVRYVDLPVTQDPSDLPVALQGDNALQITMSATGVDLSSDPFREVYSGLRRIEGVGSVIEVVQTGDFEALMTWVVGVKGKPEFRVSTSTNPATLMVDIASA